MFVVVIFFLIYGVEVFFKVRGGFTVPRVPAVISSTRTPIIKSSAAVGKNEPGEKEKKERLLTLQDDVRSQLRQQEIAALRNEEELNQMINTSQLHQSRLGLLSQALMMIITVGFLFSETLEKFWKTKVDISNRNTHDIVFRTVEIGVALWFPCVLWNCIRPEQLWCLNPKKILDNFPPLRDVRGGGKHERVNNGNESSDDEDGDNMDKGPECWICYDPDRCDAGPMINPCECRGDVGSVHHDCLRRWLVEVSVIQDDECNLNSK